MPSGPPVPPPSGDGEAYRHLLQQRDPLERLARYETMLERSLFRSLHELARVQAARKTADLVLPRAVDVLVHS